MKKMKTVPNQNTVTISKTKGSKNNKYTVNVLEAIDEAAIRLQTKAGFKLYMYMAKNQDKYQFALSSKEFCAWSGVSRTAYTSAFDELIEQGFLVSTAGTNKYTFYDIPQKEDELKKYDEVVISVPETKVEEVKAEVAKIDNFRF